METKILAMDWYNGFQCVGGICPLTCCAANWSIRLTDEEIKMYQEMEHPFRESILEQIDTEKKVLKSRGSHCAMLNDEGWCRIILECGEEYISKVCTGFPRHTTEFGDIMEATVGIVCPVAAGYLFREDSIEFDFGIDEKERTIVPIDYNLYDGLSCVRTNLIEAYQNYGRIRPAGVAFLLIACLIQIKDALISGDYSKEWALRFAEECFSEGVLQELFAREENLTKTYSEKAAIISSICKDWEGWLRKTLEKYTADIPFENWEFLWKLLGDTEAFEKAIEKFAGVFREKYSMVYENYFVYALFKNFIVKKPEEFAKRMIDHLLEYMFFQTMAAAVYEETGELTRDTYILLISMISRVIENRVDNLDMFPVYMAEKNLLTTDGLLSLLIF